MVVSDKLPPTEDERCGTYAGSRAHNCRGEVPCDSCRQARGAYNRAYHAANREARGEYSRAYHAANREARGEYSRAYRAANREAGAEYSRAYRAANREAGAEYSRAYRAANREALAEKRRAYREANREGIYLKKVLRRTVLAQAFEDVAVHNGQAWTVEDDAIIRTTYDQPRVMVAAQLRRTPWAVRGRRAILRKLDRNQRKVTS